MRFILKNNMILIGIFFIGIVVRILGFPTIPPELNRDEVALGYNAYALVHAGIDEWGNRWPVVFRSFGDMKLPGYIYTLIPSVATIGLNPFAVRLPSLLAGIMLPLIGYAFSHTLFQNKKGALWTAFFIAISPWSIHYSHVAFEANLALSLFVAGLSILLYRKRSLVQYGIGALLLTISTLTYNAPLVLLIPFLCALVLWKKLAVKHALWMIVLCCVAFVVTMSASKGKTAISIFSDPLLATQQRELRAAAGTSLIQRLQYHPVVFYSSVIMKNYFSHFSMRFLVQSGGTNPWHQPIGKGHMYYVQYVGLLLGFIMLLWVIWKKRKQFFSNNETLFLFFILCSPIVGAVTVDAPHATRTLFFLFCIQLLLGYLFSNITKKWILIIFSMILLIELGSYEYAYLIAFRKNPHPKWNLGIREAVQSASAQNEEVTMYGDPHYEYMYVLFYTAYDPKQLQLDRKMYSKDTLGFEPVSRVGKFSFVDMLGYRSDGSQIVERDGMYVFIRQ